MDEISFTLIKKLNFKNLKPHKIEDINNNDLKLMESKTTFGQFCWCSQPFFCSYLIEKYNLKIITYIESDSLFFSDPKPLFDELGNKSVTLSPHNYHPKHDQSNISGTFCTQFNTFKNNKDGRFLLNKWKEINLQYDKSRPYFYPGQLLLNDWPEKYKNVKTLTNIGAGVAPWNIELYNLSKINNELYVNNKRLIFFHFHQFGRYQDGSYELGTYPLSKNCIEIIYKHYINSLKDVKIQIAKIDSSFNYFRVYPENVSLNELLFSFSFSKMIKYLKKIKRILLGRYHIYNENFFQ